MYISIVYYTCKMNFKTNLLEECVNFVDNTKKQNKKFNIILILFYVCFNLCGYLCLFLFFVLLEYLNDQHFFSTASIQN